ncbi:MAG TPA: NAD(P)/FAD-dependent oxidoreductase [Solirubrobacterales bacterium]|jgi:NADH dehydrogenase|nr:NAD(P)/FAD-dependent oxidoreductase [Solirubrobacterales bacterium]
MASERKHRVVVIGGGFAGLNAVRRLREAPVEVTLVDRQNFHLFQPLAYQAATGALASAEIAAPLRAVLKRQANARVMMATAKGFDLEAREVVLADLPDGEAERRLPYDTLVVAGGSHYSYFGHDEWGEYAPELKSIGGALKIRGRLLSAFEAAELETDPERRRAWLTFAVVGAGPTGVEMAGQIAELARDTLRGDFRSADPGRARIVLLDGEDRVLPAFPEGLSRHAAKELRALGVEPLLGRMVVDIDAESVAWEEDGEKVRMPTRTVIWAAGVTASRLATLLGEAAGAEVDKAGRVAVGPDLTVAGRPEVLALGDMVSVRGPDGKPVGLPGLAPVAIQQGRYAAKVIAARLRGEQPHPFHYLDKGNLATIGRSKAVAELRGGIHLWGLPAWLAWLTVHIYYLIGFQNRLLVLLRWIVSFVTRGRGARLIGLGAKVPEP